MRVGVYVDGFNLYYGGRSVCGRGKPGWRWLDIRSLAEHLVPPGWRGNGARVDRVVYCTARVDQEPGATAAGDQEVYLRALRAAQACDEIVYGTFVSRVKEVPLATPTAKGKPRLVSVSSTRELAGCPGLRRMGPGGSVPDGTVFASVANREEKGSDVNVATCLLIDVLDSRVDAAIVISNDSDLERPIREARQRVPVGVVNPSAKHLAGALRGKPTDGVGRHWWRQLRAQDFVGNQLPATVSGLTKPVGW